MTTIAITSCCKIQMQSEQPAWKAIEDANPDLLLLLGDNVYSPNNYWSHKKLEQRYIEQFQEPNFNSLIKISKVPYLATWDDHDFGVNDVRGANIENWKRLKSRKLFHQYMNCSLNKPEVYCSTEIDDIKIIMLDVRYYREVAKKEATLLGSKQEKWLDKELNHNKKFTVICSGTCLKDGNEPWEAYTDFYQRFRQRILSTPRVLFLSGDIHKNRFRNHEDFFEVISSGVGRREKIGRSFGKPLDNYGIIEFGQTNVNVSLNGRLKSDQHQKMIDVNTWKLI